MKRLIQSWKVSITTAVVLFLSGCGYETVPYVDIQRYQGLWYQISANPAFFNEGLVGVTAEYSLNDDGSVKVINKGYIDTLDGEVDEIEGRAVVVDTQTNASLKVTFPGQPNLPFPNYLIVVLDDVDYQYAAVTDPLGSTLFVLSRTPQMDDDLHQNILSQLATKGIDTSKLLITPQPELN